MCFEVAHFDGSFSVKSIGGCTCATNMMLSVIKFDYSKPSFLAQFEQKMNE